MVPTERGRKGRTKTGGLPPAVARLAGERPEIVLQHMLIADPDPTPPPDGVSLVPPAPKA